MTVIQTCRLSPLVSRVAFMGASCQISIRPTIGPGQLLSAHSAGIYGTPYRLEVTREESAQPAKKRAVSLASL